MCKCMGSHNTITITKDLYLYIGAWWWLYDESKHVACVVRKYNKYRCVWLTVAWYYYRHCSGHTKIHKQPPPVTTFYEHLRPLHACFMSFQVYKINNLHSCIVTAIYVIHVRNSEIGHLFFCFKESCCQLFLIFEWEVLHICNFIPVPPLLGAWGSVVVKALRY
jgi:hypothetical protein